MTKPGLMLVQLELFPELLCSSADVVQFRLTFFSHLLPSSSPSRYKLHLWKLLRPYCREDLERLGGLGSVW